MPSSSPLLALKWEGIGAARAAPGEPSRGVPQVLERPMEARSAGRAGSICFTVSRRPDLNVASSGRVRLPRPQILEDAGAPARRCVVGLPRDVEAL